jgi:6-phosphofructokinase 2
LLTAEGVPVLVVPIAGETREDFTATETASGDQYRFVMPGPRLTRVEVDRVLTALAELVPAPDIVLASGSLPPGAPPDLYGRVARRVRRAAGRFAGDASGEALRHALQAGVWLAKPNLREMEEVAGERLATSAARLAACRALVACGQAEVVALSLGKDGAMLVSRSEAWFSPALSVRAISTIGAGDSFMGVFLWATARGEPLVGSFRWAMAAGAAALMAPGAQLCRAIDVRRLVKRVCVRPL